jgi:hypothetical protein
MSQAANWMSESNPAIDESNSSRDVTEAGRRYRTHISRITRRCHGPPQDSGSQFAVRTTATLKDVTPQGRLRTMRLVVNPLGLNIAFRQAIEAAGKILKNR